MHTCYSLCTNEVLNLEFSNHKLLTRALALSCTWKVFLSWTNEQETSNGGVGVVFILPLNSPNCYLQIQHFSGQQARLSPFDGRVCRVEEEASPTSCYSIDRRQPVSVVGAKDASIMHKSFTELSELRLLATGRVSWQTLMTFVAYCADALSRCQEGTRLSEPSPHVRHSLWSRVMCSCTRQTLTSATIALLCRVRCSNEALIHFRFKCFMNSFDSNQSQGYLGAT
jgi:hypothetical protein